MFPGQKPSCCAPILVGVSSFKYYLESFLSTVQNMGVKFVQGLENFQQGEVLFVQAAYKFLHTAKMHFLHL
jgi:hypothetical protein